MCIFYPLGLYFSLLPFLIFSMSPEHYKAFFDPHVNIKTRLEIAHYYLDSKTGKYSIHQAITDKKNIVTEYFEKIPSQDIRVNNEIIDYFFSQGLNFLAGEKKIVSHPTPTYDINLFEHLLKNPSCKKELNECCFLAHLCLFKKLAFTDLPTIQKEIVFLHILFKKRVRPLLATPVFYLIIHEYLINKFTSLKDIHTVLEGNIHITNYNPELIKRYEVYPQSHLEYFCYLGFKKWLSYYIRYFSLKKRDYKLSLQLLDPFMWGKNTPFLIKQLVEWHTHKKLKNTIRKKRII